MDWMSTAEIVVLALQETPRLRIMFIHVTMVALCRRCNPPHPQQFSVAHTQMLC